MCQKHQIDETVDCDRLFECFQLWLTNNQKLDHILKDCIKPQPQFWPEEMTKWCVNLKSYSIEEKKLSNYWLFVTLDALRLRKRDSICWPKSPQLCQMEKISNSSDNTIVLGNCQVWQYYPWNILVSTVLECL